MVTYFANAEFAANLSVKCLDFEVISEIFCTCKKFEPKVSESKNVFVKSNREIKPNCLNNCENYFKFNFKSRHISDKFI